MIKLLNIFELTFIYKYIHMLGSGSFAVVKQVGNYAVKTMHKDTPFDVFVTEVCLIKACNHYNIIKITSVDYTTMSFTMPAYDMNLSIYIDKFGPNCKHARYKIASEICTGLAYLHIRGIIHADLCCKNILVRWVNNEPSICICDFGISVLCAIKPYTNVVQSKNYRAPEVNFDANESLLYSTAIDIWSLGCILYNIYSLTPIISCDVCQDDPSINACIIFNIPGETRRLRLRKLYELTHDDINNAIISKITFKTVDHNYTKLIARCLCPNPNDRINALGLIGLLNCMYPDLHEEIKFTSLSDQIYSRYVQQTKNTNNNYKLASETIAECLNSVNNTYIDSLNIIIDDRPLLDYMIDILIALDWNIL